MAASVLGRIGDRRARDPLAAALSRWNIRREVARALDAIGWEPQTEEEEILYLAATGKRQEMLNRWDESRTVLIRLLRSAQRHKMECAVNTFIELGREDIFPELASLLDSEGSRLLADVYLHCGHQMLNKAAREWLANQ